MATILDSKKAKRVATQQKFHSNTMLASVGRDMMGFWSDDLGRYVTAGAMHSTSFRPMQLPRTRPANV